ncbi:MAG: YkuS family protein [Clostridia bacterium]|nr:YkuS family protein [Clostridia bacterium]
MIIALEEGLQDIEKELIRAGHQVVSLYNSSIGADAVVYRDTPWQYLPTAEFCRNSQAGVLMVCVRNMSPGEVRQTVENRCYGTLFE